MSRVKEIRLKILKSKDANAFVKRFHYSGKVVSASTLHFGAFLDGKLHGVMSFGAPMDKRNVLNLVSTSNEGMNAKWNEMLELNRMAFDDYLPKNSESRCISVAVRLLKKNAPHVKWILSFSDATQCGDGTIYRASGFKLTNINKNSTIYELSNGEKVARRGDSKYDFSGAKKLQGFQNRYIYLISEDAKLEVPEIPFLKIDELGAGMYKGEKISMQERRESV